MLGPKTYWKKKNFKFGNACPNVSLFRLLSDLDFKFKNKKVLELGFGHGSDINEFKKRGSNVYGIDINKKAIILLKNKYNIKTTKCEDTSSMKEFFENIKFDLIYHRDLIYYLSNNEIDKLQHTVFENLKTNGLYIFQFIENDMKIKKKITKLKEVNNKFLSNFNKKSFAEKNNPLRFLKISELLNRTKKAGFILKGKKLLIESYGIEEKKLRINRYLVFSKK